MVVAGFDLLAILSRDAPNLKRSGLYTATKTEGDNLISS